MTTITGQLFLLTLDLPLLESGGPLLSAGMWPTIGAGRAILMYTLRHIEKYISKIQDDHIRKYGRVFLIYAKDTSQAQVFLYMPCPVKCVLESIKVHKTFSFSKGLIYSHALYEFPEEEILSM